VRENWIGWIGALSLGRRSVRTIQVLSEAKCAVRRATLLRYPAKLDLRGPSKGKWDSNLSAFLDAIAHGGQADLQEHSISPYAASELADALRAEALLAKDNSGQLVVDLTGFTKFHTGVMAAEAAVQRLEGVLTLGYTIPENYTGFSDRERSSAGFSQTLIVPVVDGAKLIHESRARGIILPGHEGQRLLVALGEIDPVGGTIIHAVTPDRPDFEQVTRHRNRLAYADFDRAGSWIDKSVELRRVRAVSNLVKAEINRARSARAPLLIYPFGPKPLIFATVFTAARLYPAGSWMVYPLPTTKFAAHTEGVSSTYWLPL
jgi:hypothetical protein